MEKTLSLNQDELDWIICAVTLLNMNQREGNKKNPLKMGFGEDAKDIFLKSENLRYKIDSTMDSVEKKLRELNFDNEKGPTISGIL